MKGRSLSSKDSSSSTGNWSGNRNSRTGGGFPHSGRLTAEIHRAGLRLVVIHEIDYAMARIRRQALSETLIARLETIKQGGAASEPMVFYEGTVDVGTPAKLARFEISMDSLMQVADINMEFFHVRFILNCFIRGVENNLIACMVDGSLVGLLFLAVKEKLFAKDLEIKYIATLRGKTWDSEIHATKPLKGVGTFLVAGVWLLWKNELTTLKQVVLDAELGARKFYESVGFHSTGHFILCSGSPKRSPPEGHPEHGQWVHEPEAACGQRDPEEHPKTGKVTQEQTQGWKSPLRKKSSHCNGQGVLKERCETRVHRSGRSVPSQVPEQDP